MLDVPIMKRLVILLLVLVPNSVGQVAVKVTTNKAAYLVGEPIFVVVEVKNTGTDQVGYSYGCDGGINLTVEATETKRMPNLWGCSVGYGRGGSCGGLSGGYPTLDPGRSTTFQYLLRDYRLGAGKYLLHAKGKADVSWALGNRSNFVVGPPPPPPPPPKHKPGDRVPGEDFDLTLPLTVTAGSAEELRQAYAPYIAAANEAGPEWYQARKAIVEMAPEFLEKTIAGFASGNRPTPDLAIQGLGQIETPESRADLIKLYDGSTDLNLRRQIVAAIAGIATPEQATFFKELLPGRSTAIDDEIRVWAALGLGHAGGDVAARALAGGLSSPSPQVRQAVATALGNSRSRAAVPLLIRMYRDSDNHEDTMVAGEVCWALQELTHYGFCDGLGKKASIQQARWRRWWRIHGSNTQLYGKEECPKGDTQLPSVR